MLVEKGIHLVGRGAYKKLPYNLSTLLQQLLETEEYHKPITTVTSRLRISCAILQYK
jgi:hypothetical protein